MPPDEAVDLIGDGDDQRQQRKLADDAQQRMRDADDAQIIDFLEQ